MADLFVSYSRRDASFVEKVGGRLTAAGISVWMDTEGIDAGDRWKAAITQAVGQAKWCMLVLSPRSMESKQVAAEVNMAFDEDRPIIPILYEECDINPDLKYALSGVQYVDFTGAFQDGMSNLHQALGTIGKGRQRRTVVFDENESDARTVGGGIQLPFHANGIGAIAMVDRGAAIDQALMILIRTVPGERLGRPEFGCGIWELAFERFDEATLNAMGDRIRDSIHRWEPRAEDVSVEVRADRVSLGNSWREVDLSIGYTVRGTGERRELVRRIALA